MNRRARLAFWSSVFWLVVLLLAPGDWHTRYVVLGSAAELRYGPSPMEGK